MWVERCVFELMRVKGVELIVKNFFSGNFPFPNQKFAACGGLIFSLIVFTIAYLAQKCREQPPGFKLA